jgi:hypothetical protein
LHLEDSVLLHMFVLRCTKKLMRRLTPPRKLPRALPTTTCLGDWIATLVMIDRRPIVLAVSHLTLLPVLVPLAPARTLILRVPDAIEEMLTRVGVDHDAIVEERRAMSYSILAPVSTPDQVVMGSLSDYVRSLDNRPQESSLIELERMLAITPCGPLQMQTPQNVARVLFKLSQADGKTPNEQGVSLLHT